MKLVKVDIKSIFERSLNQSLCVASNSTLYSVGIEYMKKWFLEKFDDGFFKSVYTEGKHILDDNRGLQAIQKLKRLKPSLAIHPSIDLTFDNEKIDSNPFGIYGFRDVNKYRESFFKDTINDVYLNTVLYQNLMNFNFRVRVSTRAEQLDVYKYMKMAFRVGYTQGEYVAMDMHVPTQLMLQIAKDLNYNILDNKITEIQKFLNYLNAHSNLPFVYKYRPVKGNFEFFIRIKDMYMHINVPDISADDGEREGNLSSNYVIELQCHLRIPSTAFFSYFSESTHLEIEKGEPFKDNIIGIAIINILEIPETNEYKWEQYLTTEYMEDKLGEPLSINFKELLSKDILKVIDYSNSIGIEPCKFLDIDLYNSGKLYEVEVDWDNFIIHTDEIMEDYNSAIVIYIDRLYTNDTLIFLEKIYEDRID